MIIIFITNARTSRRLLFAAAQSVADGSPLFLRRELCYNNPLYCSESEVRTLVQISFRNWKSDVLSGVIVALVSIPIAMGYAQIAGLPPVFAANS